MKASLCVDCKHFRGDQPRARKPRHGVFRVATWYWWACLRDHHPRFFKPGVERNRFWGWKRRCLDFVYQPGGPYR
jgi:hypothetical protein